jgi:hypothetical protein
VHDHLAGKRIKCAQCGTSLVVPVESAQSAPVAEVPDGPPPRRRGATPMVAAVPAPARPPISAPAESSAAEREADAFTEVAAAVGTQPIHTRRRRGMPLIGWAAIFIGVTACIVLAVMVFTNDKWRWGISRVANDRAANAADSSPEKAVEKPLSTSPPSESVDDRSIANSTTQVAPPAQFGANARSRGEAALQAAMTQAEGEADSTANEDRSARASANVNNEVQPNQRVVVRRVTRFRDENDKESFVHDRTEGRFLKFEEGMARVALEIRIGEEMTGRVPAQDLDFGRPVALDDVDAIAALKKAGAKLTADRVGYIERLECPFKMTDELMELAARLPRLVAINANFSGVTDAGLAQLKGHKRLRELLLSQTAITDTGLAHLAAIGTLEKLDLEETKITDAGLAQLVALDKLRQVALRKTGVTDAGVAELKKNRSLRSVKF